MQTEKKNEKILKLKSTPELLKKEEVAQILKCSTRTVQRIWESKAMDSFLATDNGRVSTREMVNDYLQNRMKMSS